MPFPGGGRGTRQYQHFVVGRGSWAQQSVLAEKQGADMRGGLGSGLGSGLAV